MRAMAMPPPFLRTERCLLTPMGAGDAEGVARYLLDPVVMAAWERPFREEEVAGWIERSMREHALWGYSLMTARLHSGDIIGRAGLRRDVIEGEEILEIGWILARAYWGYGYATELARACIDYAVSLAGNRRIVAEIRPENAASVRVALRAGMRKTGSFVKVYGGKTMPHDLYEAEPLDGRNEGALRAASLNPCSFR